jgi:undecaprenyl-phosphate 4-deoxy-4-formamido-L-arabinose transferase
VSEATAPVEKVTEPAPAPTTDEGPGPTAAAPADGAPARPRVSIVIPMLNESRNIDPLFARLFPVLDGLGEPFEVVCVDDGSTDDTLAKLRAHAAKRPELRPLPLARNFGQHAAVLAGFDATRGDWVVTLDADLQNPPEEVPRLVAAMREGHDLVNTWREDRKDSAFRMTASRWINRIARRASGIELRDFGCMLRGYDRRVVDHLTRRREIGTFIPAVAMLYAKAPTEVPVQHAQRASGVSNYSLLKLLRLQLDLITSISLAPLRALFAFGTFSAGAGVAFGLLLVAVRLWYGADWAGQGVFTIFAVLFFFVGAQFLALGLLGEYIGRIYQEVRDRPVYLLKGSPAEARDGRPAERATSDRLPIDSSHLRRATADSTR